MIDPSDFMLADSTPEPPKTSDSQPIFIEASVVDPTIARGLPADIDAERVLLGAAMLDIAYFNEIAERIEPEDFSLESHRRIFQRMMDLVDANSAIDAITLHAKLSETKEIASVGGMAYIVSLDEGLPRWPRIADYLEIVRNKSMARRLMLICESATARCADQSEQSIAILEDIESRLMEVAQSAVAGTLRTVADSVVQAGGVDEYLAPILNPVEMTGLETGLYDFDAMTGGLKKGELIVIAARPGQGKTALGLNILQNVCDDPSKIAAMFSLEMSREAIERRALASKAGVNVQRAMSGRYLSNLERDKLRGAMSAVVESNLYIDDSPLLTPTQMRAKARRLKQRKGRLDIVLVDYAQLMNPGAKFESEQVAMAHISRALKAAAKELDVPVIALAQLNRASEQRSDKRPVLSDVRSSGQFEQDADLVAMIHREDMYQPDNEDVRGIADLIIAKQRNGATGIVKLAFIAEFTRFGNLSRG